MNTQYFVLGSFKVLTVTTLRLVEFTSELPLETRFIAIANIADPDPRLRNVE